MRELFKNKTKVAHDKGYTLGWDDGYLLGAKKTRAEAKKVFIKRIEKEIEEISNPMMVDIEYLDGLNRAIELIRNIK